MTTRTGVKLRHIRKAINLINPSKVFENGRVIFGVSNLDSTKTLSLKVGDGASIYTALTELLTGLPDTILTGCGLSIVGANVVVQPGTWRLSNLVYSKGTTTTLAYSVQDATLSRYDSIYADNTGAISIVHGSLSATPITPAIPNGTVKVGDVLITPTSVTTTQPVITNYVDTVSDQNVGGNKNWTGNQVYSNPNTFNGVVTLNSTVYYNGSTSGDSFANSPAFDMVLNGNQLVLSTSYRAQIVSIQAGNGGLDQALGDYNIFGTIRSFDSNFGFGNARLHITDSQSGTATSARFEVPIGTFNSSTWTEIKPLWTDTLALPFSLEISTTSGVTSLRVRRTVVEGSPTPSDMEYWVETTPTFKFLKTNGNNGTKGNSVSAAVVYNKSQLTTFQDNLYDSTGATFLKSGGGGTGTVTTVSVVTANGISGSVANATTTPTITLTLGAITPTSVNGSTSTEIGYLSGVTSAIQTQLNGKQATLGYTPYNATNPSGFISSISGIAAGGDLAGTYPNPTIKASVALTGAPSSPSLAITGTGGLGFLNIPTQTSPPTTPDSGFHNIYADASGRMTFVGSNGFSYSLSRALLTASRVYSFPDATGTIALASTTLAGYGIVLVPQETPTGTINGVNKIFTLAFTPGSSSEMVFIGSAFQISGVDYTISTNTITFTIAPMTGSIIRVTYFR